MKLRLFFSFILVCVAAASFGQKDKVTLPNGWSLSPIGKNIKLGDLPLNMAITGNGKYGAVTNNGLSSQSIQLIDLQKDSVLQTVEIQCSWLGLKFSSDDKFLFASGGNNNLIMKYALKDGLLYTADSIVLGKKWPEKVSPTGIEVDKKSQRLYAVSKESNSIYVVDLISGNHIKRSQMDGEAYTCLLSHDEKFLFVSVWGNSKVVIYDTKKLEIVDSVKVGKNPNDMCLSKSGKFLYVANSVDNTVSVIDVIKHAVVETLNAALYPDALSGSTTNSVAISKDGKTLFIANADNNCLALFDVTEPGKSKSLGFIPTGWYPTCVRLTNKGVYVLNGKGNNSLPNPEGPQPFRKNGQAEYKKSTKNNSQYIGGLFSGSMNVIQVADLKALSNYSKMVYDNTPYKKDKELSTDGEIGNPVPMKVGEASPIKHVFYIIKENRTYDQVLSDMPAGNGDTSLLLFGKNVTPNQHALADQFVLLDNFYVDAEVSADGHNWSMAAYANDYVEKTWPTNYSGRGGTYDYAANKKVALPKKGFLWDYALRAGISVRDYGEFTDDDGIIYLPDLEKTMCHAYPGWNLNIRDMDREKIWESDFDSLVKANAVPQLNFVYLPSDHTAGLKKGNYTPTAYVADNDYAVGKLIEHLSATEVWKSSAVFILEDDAQNGPDHVDAHRSIAFVAGPYVKRQFADHTMYSTSGMLRTIELILGLPPMSQYDAAAMPMYRSFTNMPDYKPFKKMEETVNMAETNKTSMNSPYNFPDMDLSKADGVQDDLMNRILWCALKKDLPYPCPKHAAFVNVQEQPDED